MATLNGVENWYKEVLGKRRITSKESFFSISRQLSWATPKEKKLLNTRNYPMSKNLVKRAFNKVERIYRMKLYGGNTPSFFIVGTQKAGTSSLFKYLDMQTGLTGSFIKEVGFFDKEYNYKKSVKWYEEHFISNDSNKSEIYFEASPIYLYRERVAKRIYDYNPNAKIIILLREPISRSYSAWNMYRQWADEGNIPKKIKKKDLDGEVNPLFDTFYKKEKCPTFSEYIDLELSLIEKNTVLDEPGILRRGIYLPQIERYVNLFGSENVLILGFEELKENKERVVGIVSQFVRGKYEPVKLLENRIFNKREYPTKISEIDKKRLSDFYEPHNSALWEYLGEKIKW